MHYIYKITNMMNSKNYIGQTVQPEKRWYQHRNSSANPTQVIHHAIKKYGAHNFTYDVIATCQTLDDANYLEAQCIEQYDSLASNGKGYNVSLGGMNAPKTPEWCAQMSIKMKEIGHRPPAGSNSEWLDTLRGVPLTDVQKESAKLGMLGKNQSDETKAKQKTGNTINGLGHGSKKGKNRNQTAEHKANLSASLKGRKTNKTPGNANFTFETAEQVRAEYKAGVSSIKLAAKHNVSKRSILNIIHYITYKG